MTSNAVSKLVLLPRLIRLRDVPVYLGMDRNRFNKEVRPSQMETPIGERGIAFDRIELDAWVDEYKSKNGRRGKRQGAQLWDAKERRASSAVPASGISTKVSAEGEFARALAHLNLKRQSAT